MDKRFANNNLGYSFERLKKGLQESQEIIDNYDNLPEGEKSQQKLTSAYARAWGKLSAIVETQILVFAPKNEDDLSALSIFNQTQQ